MQAAYQGGDIRVRGEFIREGKSFRAADVAESGLIGLLEVREEGGVNDDVGMLGEVGVRLVFLAEVGFTEPDKHAGVAFEGGFELGAAERVFESGAALGEDIGFGGQEVSGASKEMLDFGFGYSRERRGRRGRDQGFGLGPGAERRVQACV